MIQNLKVKTVKLHIDMLCLSRNPFRLSVHIHHYGAKFKNLQIQVCKIKIKNVFERTLLFFRLFLSYCLKSDV